MSSPGYIPVYSAAGKISKLLLVYRINTIEKKTNANAAFVAYYFSSLFTALDEDVHYYILVVMSTQNNSAPEEISRIYQNLVSNFRIKPENIHLFSQVIDYNRFYTGACEAGLNYAPNVIFIPSFVQDVMHACQGSGGQIYLLRQLYLKQPYDGMYTQADRAIQLHLPEEMALQFDNMYVKPFRLCIDGGNLLAGHDRLGNFIVVPVSVIEDNRQLYETTGDEDIKQQMTAELEGHFSARVIWIDDSLFADKRTGYQSCLFHADLYITLCGAWINGRELVLVAQLDTMSSVALAPDIINTLNRGLDNIALQFENEGFEVGRLPLPFYQDMDNMTSKNVQTKIFSYNNCLAENFDGIRKIYMPGYNDIPGGGSFLDPDDILADYIVDISNAKRRATLPDFTRVEKRIEDYLIEKKYFNKSDIKFISSSFLLDISMHHGSLHCLCKVLERSNLDQ